MKFYGRTEELASLRKVRDISYNFARFTVVTGRRRIGKTELVRQAFDDGNGDYLHLVITKKPEKVQCASLQREAVRVLKLTIHGTCEHFAEKLDIDEIEGLLSFESKKAKTESDEARRVREDERERFKLRYGFLADVLFVSEDVKAGTALTKDKLQCHDYVGMGVSDRCLQAGDLKSVLGRKVAFDLKRGSILLKTDLCDEAAQK